MTREYLFLQIGVGLRLVELGYYVEHFKGLLNEEELIYLLEEQLELPLIYIGERGPFVDMIRFEMAMTSLCRFGERSFHIGRDKKGRINGQRFVEEYDRIALEMHLSRMINGAEMSETTLKAVKEVAQKLARSLLSKQEAVAAIGEKSLYKRTS